MIVSTKKDFDCVQYVRKERERIARDTVGKPVKQILEYFKKKKD